MMGAGPRAAGELHEVVGLWIDFEGQLDLLTRMRVEEKEQSEMTSSVLFRATGKMDQCAEMRGWERSRVGVEAGSR